MCNARDEPVKAVTNLTASTTEETLIERSAGLEIERGSFAPDVNTGRVKSRIVITTYNIRYAAGSFLITGSLLRRAGFSRPRRRPALVGRNVLQAARAFSEGALMPPADIIALQEADRHTVRSGERHVARELARALKMNYLRAAMPTPETEPPKGKQWYLDFEERIGVGERGDTGVAVLSRWPLRDASRVELPWAECAWRPRLALAASVSLGTKQLRIFNSHIDPHGSLAEQMAQHRAVLERAERAEGVGPVVLLGDFNTLARASRVATRELLESHGYTSPLPTGVGTWRAGLLRLHTDWIFVRGARVLRWGVARPLGASDHWPVWAEIELEEN